MDHRAWEDDEGTRAVIYEGRLSITGKPSMTADDGTVALGIDLPDDWRGAVEAIKALPERVSTPGPDPREAAYAHGYRTAVADALEALVGGRYENP